MSTQRANYTSLLSDVVILYAITISSFALPLITVPYLARVLGATVFGQLCFYQGLGAYLYAFLDYGFGMSATRHVAQDCAGPQERSEAIAGVLSARLVLAGVVLIIMFLLRAVGPRETRSIPLLVAASFAAIAQSMDLFWYYQGVGRTGSAASIDLVSRALTAGATFFLVRGPNHAAIAAALPGVATLLSTSILGVIAYRRLPFVAPNIRRAVVFLKLGWSIFLLKTSYVLFTAGNAFILGLFSTPMSVAYFGGAEKITRPAVAMINPIAQALYPRFAHAAKTGDPHTHRVLKLGVLLTFLIGISLSVALCLAAPLLVRTVLGANYQESVVLLRYLSAIPALVAVSNVLGPQWLVSIGKERSLNVIILVGGVVNIVGAVYLVPRYQHRGMAACVIAANCTVAVATAVVSFCTAKRGAHR